MTHVRWRAVVLGAVVVVALNGLFNRLSILVTRLSASLAPEDASGNLLSTPEGYFLGVVDPVVVILILLFHVVGGALAGGMVPTSAGLNGAMTAVLAATVWIVRYSWFFVFVLETPALDSENGGLFALHVLAFVLFFPFTVLAGYLGGRLGGRWRTAIRS